MSEKYENKHFVLVHGFGHGAWCWYKLVPMLKANGHMVTALDLGGCGINPKQLHQVPSLSDYVQPLMDFLAGMDKDEKVVLVGHSYGGIPISLAMERFPEKVSVGVFIMGYMPNCSDSLATQVHEYFRTGSRKPGIDTKFTFDQGLENLPTSALFGPKDMAAMIYKNCSLADLELAKMLIRPNSFYMEDLEKKSLLSNERYGKVRQCYVICKEDKVLEEEFQSYIINNSPPDEVVSIAGAGHMVMLSKTQELCACLERIS